MGQAGRVNVDPPPARVAGETTFRGLRILVAPGVFLPRAETEVIAGLAVDAARRILATGRAPLVVDLCAGSGVIGLSVAVQAPGSVVHTVDTEPAAVRLSIANAELARVHLGTTVGDVGDPALLSGYTGQVDVVAANPPFIPDDATPRDAQVSAYEDPRALYGGPDGLDVVRAVIAAARRLLRPRGLLLVQHADVQGPEVRALIERAGGFAAARTERDSDGWERVACALRTEA